MVDGKADLAVGNLTLGTLASDRDDRIGNGDGTFQPTYYPRPGTATIGGDRGLNADGHPDIATANWLDGTTSVLLNDGTVRSSEG